MDDRKRELPRDTEFFSLDGTHIQDEQAFTEIANAILRLNHTLRRCGFQSVKSIELGSHEDGYRLRHILPASMVSAFAAESLRDANDTDVLFPICGVEVRYPASFRSYRRRRNEVI